MPLPETTPLSDWYHIYILLCFVLFPLEFENKLEIGHRVFLQSEVIQADSWFTAAYIFVTSALNIPLK